MSHRPAPHVHLPLLLLALGLFGLFAAAGSWQLRRADYKQTLQDAMEQARHEPPIWLGRGIQHGEQLNFHRLSTRGTWLPDKTILLDNKVWQGVVGYEVITPLQIDDGAAYVLVNRGWIAAPRLRTEVPSFPTPAGSVVVTGTARIPSQRFLELGQGAEGRVWQNLTVERFRQASRLQLLPVVIYQEDAATDGLIRVQPAPEASGIGPDRHRAYALMWFCFAGLVLVIGTAITYKSIRRHD